MAPGPAVGTLAFCPGGSGTNHPLEGHWTPPGDQRPTHPVTLSPRPQPETSRQRQRRRFGTEVQCGDHPPPSAELWGGGSRESSAGGERAAPRLPCSVACSLWTRHASLPSPGHTSLSGGMNSVLPGVFSAVPLELLLSVAPNPALSRVSSSTVRHTQVLIPAQPDQHVASELISELPWACLFVLSCKRHTAKPSSVRPSREVVMAATPEEGLLL